MWNKNERTDTTEIWWEILETNLVIQVRRETSRRFRFQGLADAAIQDWSNISLAVEPVSP
jgi:hypothetical protein